MQNQIKIVTGTVQFSSVNFISNDSSKNSEKQFSYFLSIAIKKDNIEELNRINDAINLIKKNVKKNSVLGGVREGDDENFLYLDVVSQEAPLVFDDELNPIFDIKKIYNGCSGRASILISIIDNDEFSRLHFKINSIMKQENIKKPKSET